MPFEVILMLIYLLFILIISIGTYKQQQKITKMRIELITRNYFSRKMINEIVTGKDSFELRIMLQEELKRQLTWDYNNR